MAKFLVTTEQKPFKMVNSSRMVNSRVFGPKRDEVTGEWRKLHNKEHSDL